MPIVNIASLAVVLASRSGSRRCAGCGGMPAIGAAAAAVAASCFTAFPYDLMWHGPSGRTRRGSPWCPATVDARPPAAGPARHRRAGDDRRRGRRSRRPAHQRRLRGVVYFVLLLGALVVKLERDRLARGLAVDRRDRGARRPVRSSPGAAVALQRRWCHVRGVADRGVGDRSRRADRDVLADGRLPAVVDRGARADRRRAAGPAPADGVDRRRLRRLRRSVRGHGVAGQPPGQPGERALLQRLLPDRRAAPAHRRGGFRRVRVQRGHLVRRASLRKWSPKLRAAPLVGAHRCSRS